jgi:hypothetical protein
LTTVDPAALDSAESKPPRDTRGRFARGHAAVRRRKGGGQPGNLSAARNPHRLFYRRLALPKKYAYLRPLIEGRVAQIGADKGGPEQMTAGQIALLDLYRRAHGASLLLLAEAHERGYILEREGSWALQPGALELVRFAELERRILLDLGLDRQVRDLDPLAPLARRIEAVEAAERAEQAAAEAAQQAQAAEVTRALVPQDVTAEVQSTDTSTEQQGEPQAGEEEA